MKYHELIYSKLHCDLNNIISDEYLFDTKMEQFEKGPIEK